MTLIKPSEENHIGNFDNYDDALEYLQKHKLMTRVLIGYNSYGPYWQVWGEE